MNANDKHADWLLKPTANELADAMEIRASIRRKATSRKSVTEGANDRLADQLDQAATMLRQQQAEIETYKLELYDEVMLRREQQAEIEALKAAKIRAYNNGVEDGRKPDTNNKPVAWMDYLEHSDVYDLNVSGRGIPLYTHPVKELTDEEITEIYKKVYEEGHENQVVALAKEILRKAQEK